MDIAQAVVLKLHLPTQAFRSLYLALHLGRQGGLLVARMPWLKGPVVSPRLPCCRVGPQAYTPHGSLTPKP